MRERRMQDQEAQQAISNGLQSIDRSDSDLETVERCWVCLEQASEGAPLLSPCNCPRKVHGKCLALWQLYSAGKEEETKCRFCFSSLPDWKPTLTPPNLPQAIPVVSVKYGGNTYRLHVAPGPDSFARFQRQLQMVTGISSLNSVQVTFQCKAPTSAQQLMLPGIQSFDAAIYCASISAAKRQQMRGSAAASEAPNTLPVATPSAVPTMPPNPCSQSAGSSESRALQSGGSSGSNFGGMSGQQQCIPQQSRGLCLEDDARNMNQSNSAPRRRFPRMCPVGPINGGAAGGNEVQVSVPEPGSLNPMVPSKKSGGVKKMWGRFKTSFFGTRS